MQTASNAVPASACSEHRANGEVLTQGEKRSKILRGAPRRSSSPFRVFFCILSAFLLAPLTSYAQAKYPFDLPAQSLAESLRAVGHQTSTNVMFEPRLVKGLDAPALRTETTPTEAIRLLLAGTELTALQTAASTVLIQRTSTSEKSAPTSQAVAPNGTNGYTRLAQAETNSSAQDVRSESRNSERDNSLQGSAEAEKNRVELEEIVVVGTNIRGVYPSSSPVEVYTAEDIARTGATTTEQFIQKLPQNAGTRTQHAYRANLTNASTRNEDSVNSIDLRGLGIGTTLTLLNGRRLGSSDFGQSVDISLIPSGAIQRVEVLTDGASAIYGSDAIGGVVNFVLKDDFDGAETRLDYGGVTKGGFRQFNGFQTFGRGWNSGNALASYGYFDASALERGDRDYAVPAGPGTLTPHDTRHNLLLTFAQDVGEALNVSGDAAFGRRQIGNAATSLTSTDPLAHRRISYESETDQLFASLALDYRLAQALNASLQASYSQIDVDSDALTVFFNRTPPTSTPFPGSTHHEVIDITAMLDGALFDLPGGPARFSIGGGWLDEQYQGSIALVGLASARDFGRTTTYAFGEIFAPLIGAAQDIPFVHRLELSLAGRYTGYDDASSPPASQDFGDAFDPKIGLYWAPFESFGLRGTYGTSFRAPALTQLDPTGTSVSFNSSVVLGQPASQVFLGTYPAAELDPETAETFTAGFDFRPTAHPSLRISGTYYSIEYTDRVARAPFNNDITTNPQLYPDAIYRAPSAAYLQQAFADAPFHATIGLACPGVNLADRAAVAACVFALPNLWVRDNRSRNLTLSEQDGFDLSMYGAIDTPVGNVSLGASVTRILSYRQQGARTSPVVTNVDLVGAPVDLRGRAFAGLSRGGFNGTINVNYVDDYRNRAPAGIVRSWTTTDLSITYDFAETPSAWLRGVRISLSAQNLFDQDPPFVAFATGVDQIGFDPTNANPLGRLVVLGLTKRW